MALIPFLPVRIVLVAQVNSTTKSNVLAKAEAAAYAVKQSLEPDTPLCIYSSKDERATKTAGFYKNSLSSTKEELVHYFQDGPGGIDYLDCDSDIFNRNPHTLSSKMEGCIEFLHSKAKECPCIVLISSLHTVMEISKRLAMEFKPQIAFPSHLEPCQAISVNVMTGVVQVIKGTPNSVESNANTMPKQTA